MEENEPLQYSDEEAIKRIIKLTEGLANFWSSSRGWAPVKAAEIMTKSRLDWQAFLARTLIIFTSEDVKKETGALILAWTTLGSLTEGILKLFLSVWYTDYNASVNRSNLKAYKDKKNNLIDPDILILEKLRVFFSKKVFPKETRAMWQEQGRLDLIEWILKIQQRRNAIHAFKHREIGDFDEFFEELKKFLIFMRRLTDTFPYPDDIYRPKEI